MNAIIVADARRLPIADSTAQCCITSPPYFGLRDYGVDGQIGLGALDEYIDNLVAVFREVWRVLKDDGTLWLNLGDSYAANRSHQPPPTNTRNKNGHYGITKVPENLKPKDLIGVPWRVAFALQADGWYLRSEIIWHKPNPMPESVTDRPTRTHETIFLLSKAPRYFYDADAIRTTHKSEWWKGIDRRREYMTKKDGRNDGGVPHGKGNKLGANKRTVWTIATRPFHGAHFATFPEKLVEPMMLAGSRSGDLVLDPFAGAGTVGVVAKRFGRRFIGTELNPGYAMMANERIKATQQPLFA